MSEVVGSPDARRQISVTPTIRKFRVAGVEGSVVDVAGDNSVRICSNQFGETEGSISLCGSRGGEEIFFVQFEQGGEWFSLSDLRDWNPAVALNMGFPELEQVGSITRRRRQQSSPLKILLKRSLEQLRALLRGLS